MMKQAKNNLVYVFLVLMGLTNGCAPKVVAQDDMAKKKYVAKTEPRKYHTMNSAKQDFEELTKDYQIGTVNFVKVDNLPNSQSFSIECKNKVTNIEYSSEKSFNNAVYTLLELWGFGFYGITNKWVVKPKKINFVEFIKKTYNPTYVNREFFGTGGLGSRGRFYGFDTTNSFAEDIWLWKQRLRINSENKIGGHTGGAFYKANKEILDANPQWFNSESGKKNGRFKIENDSALQCYKDWIYKSQYLQQVKNGESHITLSVDPEDGRGGKDDPLPPNGFRKISNWNHADKWWYVANEIAKQYKDSAYKVTVSMYAYGDGPTNALTPKFDLEENVYPMIIPYAFQTAYIPSEMIKEWGKKSKRLAIYDYYNITQWSKGLPQGNVFGVFEKENFWAKNKIDGVNFETTDAGVLNMFWWLNAHLLFDIDMNVDSAYNAYFSNCFGSAGNAIKQMFTRWSKNPQGKNEWMLNAWDLKKADDINKNKSVAARLNDLKAYNHFIRLMSEHNDTDSSKENILKYIYRIHDRRMIQTVPFTTREYISQPKILRYDGLKITSGMELSDAEINEIFKDDLAQAINYTTYFDEKDISQIHTDLLPETQWKYGRLIGAYLYGPAKITFGSETMSRFNILSPDEKLILDDSIGIRNYADSIVKYGNRTSYVRTLLLPDSGKYILKSYRGAFSYLSANVPIYTEGAQEFDNGGYPKNQFYVPENCTEIIFENWIEKSKSEMISPSGKIITGDKLAKNLFRIKVDPVDRGKIWKSNIPHRGWNILNLKKIYKVN